METDSPDTTTAVQAEPTGSAAASKWGATAAFLLVFFLILIPGKTDLLCDPGIFWHIAVGERILSTGSLIDHDPYSFTYAGQPWIAQQWLAECAMAILHAAAGLTGIVVTSAAIVATIFGWAALRFSTNGLQPMPTLAVVLLATAAVSGHLHGRPHLATMAFFAITIVRLSDVERGRSTSRSLWGLAPLYIVWTNLHGGMLGGVITVALAVAGWFVFWKMGLKSPITKMSQAVELALMVVAFLATSLVNPYGTRLLEIWKFLTQADLTFIAEHAPLDPRSPIGQLTLAVAVLYALVIGRVSIRAMQVSWLIPLSWLVLGSLHIRHAPLFSILAVFVIADALPSSAWGSALCRRHWLLPKTPAGTDDWKQNRRMWACWLILPAVLFGVASAWHMCCGEELWASPCEDVWPATAIPEVQRYAEVHPDGTRVFNEMQYGGFLISVAPRLRVFVDDRCELYGEQFLRDVLAGSREPTRLQSWIDEYDINAALVRNGSAFDRMLANSADWELISAGSANFFVRR